MPKNKILLVDSDIENLRLYEISFRRAGLVTTTATDGADALKKLELFQPDLIVSEVSLPQMDGYEFCAEVKNDPRYRTIPFLFLTKEKSIENKVMGLELGADDYLVKPIFIKELITRVKMLIDRRDKEGMQVHGGKSLSGNLGEMEIVDLIQIMDMGVKSGTILLSFEGGDEGKIFFRKGKLSHVQYGKYIDMKAFARILNRSRGEFNIEFSEPDVEDTIELNTHEFVMEGMRWIDEWRGVLEGMPPLDSVLAVNSELVLEANPDNEVFEGAGTILSAFDGLTTISDIIDSINANDLDILKKISHLYFEGYLIEVSPGELEEKKAAAETPHKEFIELEEDLDQDDSIAHIFVEESGPDLKEISSPQRGKTLAEIEQQGDYPSGSTPSKEGEDFFVEEEVEFEEEQKPPARPANEFEARAEPKMETEAEPKPEPRAEPPHNVTVQQSDLGGENRFEWSKSKAGVSEEELWFLPPEDEARLAQSKRIEVIDRTPQRGVISAKKPTKIVSIIEDAPPQLPVEGEPRETREEVPEPESPVKRKVYLTLPVLVAAGVVGVFTLGVITSLVILKVQKRSAGPDPTTVVTQVPLENNVVPATPATAAESPPGEGEEASAPGESSVVNTATEPPPSAAQVQSGSPAVQPESGSSSSPSRSQRSPEVAPAPEPLKKPAPAPKPEPKPEPKPKPKPAPVVTPKRTVPQQTTRVAVRSTPTPSRPAPAKAPSQPQPERRIDPGQSRIHHLKGKALYQQGKIPQAIAELAQAVTLNPKNAEAYYDLGVAYNDQGQDDNAIQALRWAVGMNLKNPEAYRLLGLLYQKKGDQKNSQIYFQKYITMLSE